MEDENLILNLLAQIEICCGEGFENQEAFNVWMEQEVGCPKEQLERLKESGRYPTFER